MAQDFGDEMGDSLRRAIGRAFSLAIREWMRERDFQRRLDAQNAGRSDVGDGKAELDLSSDAQEQPDEVYLNFGEANEAERFAELCRDKGIDVTALTDADGRGFIRFSPADLEKVQDVAPEFAELMTRLQIERVNKTLEAEPVSPDKVKELTEVKAKADHAQESAQTPLAAEVRRVRAASAALEAEEQASHTERIAAEVRGARSQCKTLDELEHSLAEKGIGTTVSKDGEVMFYEPRLAGDGTFLPYSHEQGDWAVGARVLKERYGVDATHDSFLVDGGHVDELVICNTVRADVEDRGFPTYDRDDGLMGFHVDFHAKDVTFAAVERRYPGHVPDDLGIIFDKTERGPLQNVMQAERKAQETARNVVAAEPREYEPDPNGLRVRTQRPGEPQVADGSLDMDGRTPDLNQGIESHDGMDTDVSTLRLEREQNGTDVAPSVVREEAAHARDDDRSLDAVAKECRAASKQLEHESGIAEHELDVSDKLNPVR